MLHLLSGHSHLHEFFLFFSLVSFPGHFKRGVGPWPCPGHTFSPLLHTPSPSHNPALEGFFFF